jgi:hypothetical protein
MRGVLPEDSLVGEGGGQIAVGVGWASKSFLPSKVWRASLRRIEGRFLELGELQDRWRAWPDRRPFCLFMPLAVTVSLVRRRSSMEGFA